MKKPLLVVSSLLIASALTFAQAVPGSNAQPQQPQTQQPANQNAGPEAAKKTPNKAMAYYHYALAHMYEELVAIYQRTEFANRAIEEYKLAIENDPTSEFLNAGLAELYAKTGRIRDAVLEAQEILKRDPNNVDARRLLGRIYLRSLGDLQGGTQSQEILRRAIEQYEAIVRLQPTSIEDRLLLGRLYRINNDTAKAEEQFRESVKLDPKSDDAVTTLAYLYNETGQAKRAEELLLAIPEAQRSGKLYGALGYTYEQQREYKKAIEAYRKALDQDKDNLDLLRSVAQSLMSDGQNDAALEQYKIIIDADPQDPQTHMRMAEIYRRTGRFDQALASLDKAQAYVQDSLEVPYNRAVILQAQGKFDEAIQILNTLAQKTEKADGKYSPGERNNRAVFLERLGSLYRDTGKQQLAVDAFRKMLPLGDENAARGYQELIETYRQAKHWQQATAVAEEAVKALPNDRLLRLAFAQQLADAGQMDAGISQARAMLKGGPEDREVYLSLAQIQGRLRKYKEAEESLNKALALSKRPEERDYALFVQASLLERQKKYDEAEAVFRKLLASDPNNAMVLNYLGYMLADRGTRLEESLQMLKKAVQLDPQNGAYLDSIGWAYFKMGNYELAEQNLLRALERVPGDPTIHDHIADLYARTGRLKLAAGHWERALEEWNKSAQADSDPVEIAKVQKKLESAKVKLARQQPRKAADASTAKP